MKLHRKWMFFAPPIFIAAVFLFGWVVMLLWNNILVPSLHIGALSFWQGVGLLVLARILFGGFGRGGKWKHHNRNQQHFRQKWANMSDEERIKFKEQWKNKCRDKES